jgi:ketosteroid isomerase-like protein
VGASAPEIERFLVAYAEAVSAGDGEAVAEMYELPALVLSDDGSIPVTSRDQVVEFFSAAPEQYREVGIVATRAEAVAIEQLSDELCTADVRWLGIDAEGRATNHRELATYLLRRRDDGSVRIQVAISRPSLIPRDD